MDAWGSVHRIADCQSPLLDAMGEDLVVFAVDLQYRNIKEGGVKTHVNFCL